MNKIVSIKDTSAIFLAIVLVTGIVALSSQSFKTANALSSPLFTEENKYESTGYQPEYAGQKSNSYESTKYGLDIYEKKSYRNDIYQQQPEYSTYTPDYKQQYSSYGKDNNTYKSKENTIVKKINCNNINVNLNGLNVNAIGTDDSNGPTTDTESAQQGYGDRNNGYDKSDNGFKFVCINNNNNGGQGNGTTPIPPEPLTCEDCFEEVLNSTQFAILQAALPEGLIVHIGPEVVEVNSLEEYCNLLEAAGNIAPGNLVGAIESLIADADVTSDLETFAEVVDALFACLVEALDIELPPPI